MPAQLSFADFLQSTATDSAPPDGLNRPLQALWHDRQGRWAEAHTLVQESDGADGAWVHAYLHRSEGDESNAGYWYARAGRPAASGDLKAEWEQFARALLKR
ncbi:MAG: hypothetical protein EXS42_06910 [Lacunisphaera sp.]|nr:hypothetical protein [Lacunisphaera sp.]